MATTATAYRQFYEHIVSGGGCLADMRHRYRRLAFKLHPDRGGSKEQFQACHDAYQDALRDALRQCDDGGVADMDWEPTPAPEP
jgi:DnaJ-class molecular chaperone